MLKKLLVVGIAVVSSLITLNSCQNINGSSRGDSSDSTAGSGKKEHLVKQDTSRLMDLLDSVNKGKIVFAPVDSVNKIDPKTAKKRLKDSIYRELDKKDKHIYLTFDDGPLIGSRAIDSIATAQNIRINAFLIGMHVHMSKRLTNDYHRYMNNPLVECYNHSYTHANNRYHVFYSNPEKAAADFEKCETDLKLTHKIIRMPGRNIWLFDGNRRIDFTSGSQAADLLGVKGYKIYGWDMEWKINGLSGTPVQSVNEIYTRVKTMLGNKTTMKPNNIVLLMHDDMFQNVKGQRLLSNLIDSLKQHKDYKFEFVSKYPIKY